ncbi:dipeptidase [Maridesulfovibrio hydrothermalis]|uniref:Dipeptidase n=1 Tax=Maridesulfovibrio hydrothermalis AM13 = DSM 14728 TaxID=1121451 RepID=L0R8S3_9BACT|nr:C69 family dipeptidase [Maridesulfovibrio hydrothermalis]CCO23159.1 Peptidase U34 dipeptidase [Maridesulfovibrio hydrothermalis AM13 = DSM 14728]
MKRILSVIIAVSVLLAAYPVFACTTTLTGKKASADGSVMVSHSDDGLGDGRLIYVPAMDHKKGSMRPVYYDACALGYKPEWGASETQRLVTKERGPGYDTPGVPLSVPIGYIPQVEHTYAYFDANYGIMNEHQLSIGECTDKAKVEPEPAPGKRIFYSSELSRVALERCKKAKDAVKLMGALIDKYGYYGTGETLLVADPEEGWVFEMCGYDAEGTGGVWVAKRVPDDSFFVAANQFRIREVKKGARDMMFSADIFDIAKKKGWWNPSDGPLDWAKVYGDGEFHHPYYSLRRVWRAQSLVAPSKNLPAWVEGAFTKKYPFAVKPDQKLSVEDVFRIHRDNYEGTEFDLTKGLAAGPFNDPNRFEGRAESVAGSEEPLSTVKGAFERPLNIYRCVYAYVNQSRKWLPDAVGGLTWFGPDRPATAVLMPFYAGVNNLPEPIQKGDILKFEKDSMWTAFNYVANYAMLKYGFMIKDIHAVRDHFEMQSFGRQKQLEQNAAELIDDKRDAEARKLLTGYCEDNADNVLKAWWKLSEDLYIKYNDGYLNTSAGIAQSVFYPAWWLKKVGYENGPLTYKRNSGEK